MSEDLYQRAIIELAKRSRQQHRLGNAGRSVTVDNPLCGDRITLDLILNGDIIGKIGHKTRGCLLCEASACLIVDHAPGEAPAAMQSKAMVLIQSFADEGQALDPLWPGLATLAPARSYKSRHDCVTMPFKALVKILDEGG